ncbi:MAG: hypothetical protein ACM3JC_01545 [Rudaea sp.]
MRRQAACAIVALLALAHAHAAPPSRAELTALCRDAEDQAACGRLVEAPRLRALSRILERNGDELRVSLSPTGLTTFRDSIDIWGATSYAVWDYLAPVDTLVLFTTRGERAGFLLVQRQGGEEYPLPSEPVVAPDHRHFVTADVCPRDCVNELALWSIVRKGVRKVATWKPPPAWTDASVTWLGRDTLAIEYSLADDPRTQTLTLPLSDPSWTKAAR